MKAYSVDLRQKIIETYEQEFISQQELAERFRVSLSTVTRVLRQYHATGQLEPKPRPGRPQCLSPEQVEIVQALVTAQPDITLGELSQALKDTVRVSVSEPTLCRVLKRLNLTRKKSLCIPPIRELSGYNFYAVITGTRSEMFELRI